MKFDKTQKRALVFVAGLLGLSWYMGGQFEKADMMRSEGKMRSEADAYAYAYNEGHSDNRKDEDYQPVLSSGREEGRFRKILKQRAETFNAELEEEEFGEYFLDMDVYDDILSYTPVGDEIGFFGNDGFVEIHVRDEFVGDAYVWRDSLMEEEFGGEHPYIIINHEMFHLNDLKRIDLGAETFNAEDEKRINGMTLDDWLDELDRIKATKEPFYYSNNILGSPKYGNMIDVFWEQGWTPQGTLDAWESYDRQKGHWEKVRAETFNAQTTKKPKLTKTQLAALNMMKASTFYGSGGYAYVEVDNRGWKSYTTRPVQGLLDKGIITIPKDENRRFYGRVKSMEHYIVYLNPVAWEYPFQDKYDKSLSQVGDKIVQNKKIQQQEHARILKQKQDEENMTLKEVLDELFGAETFNAELEEEEFGEYFLDMDVYDDILSYALTGGNEFFLKGEEGGDYVEIFINDESVGETYVWWDKDMEQEVGGDCRYIIINNEMFHLNDLKEIDLGAESFSAECEMCEDENEANCTVCGGCNTCCVIQTCEKCGTDLCATTEERCCGTASFPTCVDCCSCDNFTHRMAESFNAPSEGVVVKKDVTPKGSKVIVEECVDIQAKKADTTSNYYRVRFRDPTEMSNFRVPAWAARAANTMGSKYYDVAGSKVTMGQDKSGNWKIQSVMVPKRANVDVDLALKIANHIQDRLEKEGKWAPKKCQDNERVLVIR